ncbi:uncharacterized protein LOC128999399 isoform X2 [Macrosteles quadrilineatus]|uniref:uncharacterized protein LOC128999399 isoform X2 n=1 Tax=Macrosteles quadrilineatus TaxID=74068 RepID=UPI0023E182F7|nr:uncharacterized protein LOC128999399 isoform X2 [Macrosteles quadrilineatus]
MIKGVCFVVGFKQILSKLPKTDNVYSPCSQLYGCTLAPGIPLIPNLCRRPLRSADEGYDYTTSRTSRYTRYSQDDSPDLTEHNNYINTMLNNGHSDHNNTQLLGLNLPLPRRRIEFNDSGLDSDSEIETYDNHIGYTKTQVHSQNHVTWFSWILTIVTTIVTTVVTTVTETIQLRQTKQYDTVDTRVPLKQTTDVSWYQYPVLWLYKMALAVQKADVWLLWKVNSLLQVDKWGTSQQRRKWALILLLIPIILWAAYYLYGWLSEEDTSPVLETVAAWTSAPFLYFWDTLSFLAGWSISCMSSGIQWFDGSWISYPWVALVGWWESSADNTSTDDVIEEAWDLDFSGVTAWITWPFYSFAALLSSLGSYSASAVATLGEGAATTFSTVVYALSTALLWIYELIIGIPAVVVSGFAALVAPLQSISWPASPPTPDYTPSAPHYESQFNQLPPSTSSAANWDHLLGDQQLLAALVRRLLSSTEFDQVLKEKQLSNQAQVETTLKAAVDRIDLEVDKVRAELSDKIVSEESSVESKMELLKQQIQDLQMALNAHKTLVSEQAAFGSKLEEKLSTDQSRISEDQVIILKEQILLEVAKVREEIVEQVINLQINQKVVSEASPDSLPNPVTSSTELEAFVNATVERLLAIYDADKVAKVDYALASSGATVVSTRCTETFSTKSANYHVWGYPLWSKAGNDPKVALEPGIVAGQCWAFVGNQGFMIIELSQNITITGFTMEHLPKSLSPSGNIDTAPQDFHVLGLESEKDDMPILLGKFTYLDNGKSLQYFDALEVDHSFKMVELVIESNHGSLEYTCLYRFRVHGRPISTP